MRIAKPKQSVKPSCHPQGVLRNAQIRENGQLFPVRKMRFLVATRSQKSVIVTILNLWARLAGKVHKLVFARAMALVIINSYTQEGGWVMDTRP